jgi:hypothetical protein
MIASGNIVLLTQSTVIDFSKVSYHKTTYVDILREYSKLTQTTVIGLFKGSDHNEMHDDSLREYTYASTTNGDWPFVDFMSQ